MTGDTLFGRVSLKYDARNLGAPVKIVTREIHRYIPVAEISAFRIGPGLLYSDYVLPFDKLLEFNYWAEARLNKSPDEKSVSTYS